MASPRDIIALWLDAGPKRWFAKDDAFDARLRAAWLGAHEQAAGGALRDWTRAADGALALLLLTDQFPRNAFRGEARAFSTDAMARGIAGDAIARGHDGRVEPSLRQFIYVPFMHSEALADQDLSVALYHSAGERDGESYARMHRDIIARFGRFPHRNGALGRATTPEEKAFLDAGGFAG